MISKLLNKHWYTLPYWLRDRIIYLTYLYVNYVDWDIKWIDEIVDVVFKLIEQQDTYYQQFLEEALLEAIDDIERNTLTRTYIRAYLNDLVEED